MQARLRGLEMVSNCPADTERRRRGEHRQGERICKMRAPAITSPGVLPEKAGFTIAPDVAVYVKRGFYFEFCARAVSCRSSPNQSSTTTMDDETFSALR